LLVHYQPTVAVLEVLSFGGRAWPGITGDVRGGRAQAAREEPEGERGGDQGPGDGVEKLRKTGRVDEAKGGGQDLDRGVERADDVAVALQGLARRAADLDPARLDDAIAR